MLGKNSLFHQEKPSFLYTTINYLCYSKVFENSFAAVQTNQFIKAETLDSQNNEPTVLQLNWEFT